MASCTSAPENLTSWSAAMAKIYRLELELHSQLLRRKHISTLDDFYLLQFAIYPQHFQFVDVDWDRLKRHLRRKSHGRALIAGARQRAASLSRLRHYLRRHGVANFHRFLVPLAINKGSSAHSPDGLTISRRRREQTQPQSKSR
jgi:hypothetical protein